MKTSFNFGFDISAKGMSIQRKKMNIIAENIANSETTRTSSGEPYKKKFIEIIQKESSLNNAVTDVEGKKIKLNISNQNHIENPQAFAFNNNANSTESLSYNEREDKTPGEMVFMPDHPDANDKGYVQMSNVNVVNEMVDMIAASRGYEANSTALGASKQIAKDSLEI